MNELKSETGVEVLLFQYQRSPSERSIVHVFDLHVLLKQHPVGRILSGWGDGALCI